MTLLNGLSVALSVLAMNEKKDFALVPRLPDAIQKSQPGARRILSGMVVDTLALTKKEPVRKSRPLKIVMVNDESVVLKSFEFIIRSWFSDATVMLFDNAGAALAELSQTIPDLVITDDAMPGMRGSELCQRLLERRVAYPIIVDSPWEPTEQWVRELADQGLNVHFLPLPYDHESLRRVMESAGFEIPHTTPDKIVVTMPQSRKTQPPRVVILDDEEGPRKSWSFILKSWYEDIEILEFANGDDAWLVLSESDFDLLITDIRHPGISCQEMLGRLSRMKATCQILITSAGVNLNVDGKWVWGESLVHSWGTNLKISCFSKPVELDGFRMAVESALQISARRIS